ncbi:GntR family transcriptional regulator [Qingshengfaniella alkalisoli]|uniref:GntR family transcriptional regulator n=1 Tax=Qingshengfaniella alkalisoli TaxID=2599296 RepID=A0A5B8I9R3_9RHOB|nr:GntR family transcriptional regulator [Qingshengfaniella alkalisoli]QDY71065.1 GntR family transcriptional regulator [Qingshengfaniella alkalisoli]
MEHANPSSNGKETRSQADAISAALTSAIHRHRIAPGTKLGEEDLADIYGVSRTIIRSVLHGLAHLQLVEIHRNRGAFVASPSIGEAHEVFEARALVEPMLARRAAVRASANDLELLRKHIEEEHAALAQQDAGRALHLSGLFHIEMARIADHATIAGFVEGLVARSSLIIALYWRRESALCEKHAHHALLDALARADGQEAEARMKSHLVDLHTALDLRERQEPSRSLKEVLGP